MRIGFGYDVHRFAPGIPLILGGVEIPCEMGLAGHSDGDALTHAIIDSLLGAASLGDIGSWFPSDEPRWKGVSSLELLRQVKIALEQRSYAVGNLDTVVVCERPRLQPHIAAMRASISRVLKIEVANVSVKATTAEKLGTVGEELAVEVHAVALLTSSSAPEA